MAGRNTLLDTESQKRNDARWKKKSTPLIEIIKRLFGRGKKKKGIDTKAWSGKMDRSNPLDRELAASAREANRMVKANMEKVENEKKRGRNIIRSVKPPQSRNRIY